MNNSHIGDPVGKAKVAGTERSVEAWSDFDA